MILGIVLTYYACCKKNVGKTAQEAVDNALRQKRGQIESKLKQLCDTSWDEFEKWIHTALSELILACTIGPIFVSLLFCAGLVFFYDGEDEEDKVPIFGIAVVSYVLAEWFAFIWMLSCPEMIARRFRRKFKDGMKWWASLGADFGRAVFGTDQMVKLAGMVGMEARAMVYMLDRLGREQDFVLGPFG